MPHTFPKYLTAPGIASGPPHCTSMGALVGALERVDGEMTWLENVTLW